MGRCSHCRACPFILEVIYLTIEQVIVIVFTAFISFLSGRAQNIVNRRNEESEKKEAQFQHIIDQQREFADWQADIGRKITELDRKLILISGCTDRLKSGSLTILRDRIIQSCRIFLERGSIPITARNNIREMYKCYHDEFNGNGDGEYYFKKMMELPVDQDIPVVSHFDMGGSYDRKN